MDPITEAEKFKELVVTYGSQAAAARAQGISRTLLVKRLRLLDLPKEVQCNIKSGSLSINHGLALLRLPKEHRAVECKNLEAMSGNESLKWATRRTRELSLPWQPCPDSTNLPKDHPPENQSCAKRFVEDPPVGNSLPADAMQVHASIEDALCVKLGIKVAVKKIPEGYQFVLDATSPEMVYTIFSKLLKE